MSLETKLLDLAQQLGADMGELFRTLNDIAIGPPLSVTRTGEDANGLFTIVSHLRSDNTLYKRSTLSGGTSPLYTTRTVVFYEADGLTAKSTQVYTLSYNTDGVIVSEILQS